MLARECGKRFHGSVEPGRPHSASCSESPDLVFISCSDSRLDQNILSLLLLHLRVLANEGEIEIFIHDAQLPGTLWRQETRSHIDRAAAAILLISPEYLASADLMEDQLPRLLQRAQECGTSILPLLIRPSMFHHLPKLSCFKPFNPMSKTLIRMRSAEREEFLLSVAETAEEVIHRRRERDCDGTRDCGHVEVGLDAQCVTTS